MRLLPRLRRFRDDTSGLALVEFAICLPLTLLIFATIIEGGRMVWSLQAAVAGVRDATRYVSRTVEINPSCVYNIAAAPLVTIVQNRLGGAGSALPSKVTVENVSVAVNCPVASQPLRIPNAPVATVTAEVTIVHPWSAFFGGNLGSTSTVLISDEARIYGI